jgi:3-(3-hydroxy-phenyl)propionate hydroxylase
VVDVQVNERGLAKLPRTSVQYCEPARPCTYVIGPGNHRRWEISLLPGEDPGVHGDGGGRLERAATLDRPR